MASARTGTLREVPMRPILLIVAAAGVFFLWDGLENKSAYRIALMKSIEQAENFQGLVRISWN
jgi:hypothetical protein